MAHNVTNTERVPDAKARAIPTTPSDGNWVKNRRCELSRVISPLQSYNYGSSLSAAATKG